MNPIEILEQEHRDIERELLELETVEEDEAINYPNLIHVFKRLHDMWNKHEEKEEKIFRIMKKEKIIVPMGEMLFEHKELRRHYKEMKAAIDSGSMEKIKMAFEKHLNVIIKKIRENINKEDEVLYTIAMQEFTPEELKEMWKSVK